METDGDLATAETMELTFTLQLKTTPSPEDPSPIPVQNGHPSMPASQELAITKSIRNRRSNDSFAAMEF